VKAALRAAGQDLPRQHSASAASPLPLRGGQPSDDKAGWQLCVPLGRQQRQRGSVAAGYVATLNVGIA
jgi:hypothetical protein